MSFAKKVIALEKKGLVDLEKKLDNNFNLVIEKIKKCKGKLIFSGIGKAGLIAQKIASTFSSLGKSAFFMHSAEAAHGDLGMIREEDLVFLFSNSGETKETTSIIGPIKKIKAPLIAVTSNSKSYLASEATLTLLIGKSEEACFLGLAPTTSTTAMLVLGDALAVSLVESDKQFTENSFASNHPGGSLGLRLMYVKEVMRKQKDIAQVTATTKVGEALLKMTNARIGLAVITNNKNNLVGIFSDGDLRRLFTENHQMGNSIKNYMNKSFITINQDQYVWEAQKIMVEKKVGEIPVLNQQEKLVGVICLKDITV